MALSVATGSSGTETVDENGYPTLRLTLVNRANKLGSSRPRNIHVQPSYWESFLRNTQDGLDLEEVATPEATARNQEKLQKIGEKIKEKIDANIQQGCKELETLSPKQQEDVLTFWSGVGEFFKDFFNWFKEMFQSVMNKIRMGFTVIKKEIQKIFKETMKVVKKIFS